MSLKATVDRTQDRALEREMLALQRGEHLCLIYDDHPSEQLPAILPYIQQGLRDDERCIYIADDSTLHDLESALNAYGVDVAAELARGALKLWTRDDWRQPGELDSGRKAEQVRGMIDAALADGFSGVRFGVEMTWTLGPDISAGRLRHWEALINTIFTSDVPGRIICQYSRARLAPEVIHAGLLTHPTAVIDDDVCPNPFYEDPLADIAPDSMESIMPVVSARRIDWMIAQLQRARAYEKEHRRRIDAERELLRAGANVRRLQNERDLSRIAAEKLRRANMVKNEFIGMVSHELRTPITVVLGNAHLLLKTLPLPAGPHRDALTDIRMEAERLRRVVTNLLSFAGNDEPPSLEPLLLAAVVGRVVQDHRGRFPKRRIDVSCFDQDTPALGNDGYLEQALGNLLSNAERYSPPDTVIDVAVMTHDGMPTVCVLDRGIGLLDAEAERVFEPFYRSAAANRIGSAVGIGLTVAKRLIDAQGGQIWARPRVGGGAEFGFSLQACEAPSVVD